MNIISFSLWGNEKKYCVGAIKNAELAKSIYPEWRCVFHVGGDVEESVLDKLAGLDCDIIRYSDSGWNGMFWRFYSADGYDVVISRDTDSRLNHREKAAVNEWLNSNKDFHIMRDHPYHGAEILGGMWGCRNGILRGIISLINDYNKNNQYQVDQNFLREIIYPKIKDNCYIHDEFFSINCPFPVKRLDNEYVGSPFDENDNLLIGFR